MKNANITNVKWGEIYLCDLGSNKGSVQSGKRPVLVLQNNIGNNNGPTTVVATISSVLKKLNQPTHILLDTSCGLREDSIVMLEQIRTVDKEKELLEYIGEVRDEKTIYAIKQGILTEFGLIKRPQPRRTGLILTLCPKCRAEFMSVPENVVRRVDPLQVDKERCDKCQTWRWRTSPNHYGNVSSGRKSKGFRKSESRTTDQQNQRHDLWVWQHPRL